MEASGDMDGISEDEDWLEAELERQLAADDAYDSQDDEDEPRETEAAVAGGESHMEQFRELMAQMEQWGEAAARRVEESLLETAAAASNAERELQERPPPPELLHVEPPAPDTMLSALELNFEDFDPGEATAPTRDSDATEADALSFLAELAVQARAAALEELAARQAAEASQQPDQTYGQVSAGDLVESSDGVELSSHAILEDQLEPGEEVASFQAVERRIEEERLACLRALENQHEELIRDMQRDEEERREEEACLREQVNMHTQELQCREFYQEERRAERRDRRRIQLADREGRRVQEEEQRMKENAERAQEAHERQRLEVEDHISAAIRRREHEKREGRRMGLEDNLSKSWRQKLRMDFEIQCLHRADKEGHRWRDKSKEVQELQQMALEDERSRLQQLCSPVEFSEAVQGQRNAETVPVDISVLSRMVIPISSGEVKSSSTVREGELDCWDRAPRSTRRASKAPEVHTCGNAICVKLYEGARRKRGRRRSITTSLACRPPPHEATSSGISAADLGLELAGGLDDLLGPATGPLVRLEVRMEGLESLPILSRLPQLRALILSGNKINGSLEALRHCPHLEELDLCQNSLTSLDGLRHLKYLSVLKATMNEISDAEDLAHLSMLRVLDLSKNRLTSVQLSAPVLAKLVLYRNAIDSTSCLRQLPSLTQLDLGRNKLTELDDISEWTPLLQKAFLYENRLVSLPELHLPLLTDLWVDNNQLEVLGPLGFLPSLERLQAKHNRLRALAHPIAASPLLKTLELAFNNLDATDIPKAVSPLQRLTRLQLNDNPLVNELMEQYRPWILRLSPQVEELDNETVSEVDRRAALPPAMAMVGMVGMGRAVARSFRVSEVSPPGAHQGLLGLVAPKRTDATAARPNEVEWEGIDGTPSAAKEALLERWKAAWSGPGPSPSADESGCQMCALACWCEALNAARSVPLVAHIREERRSATLLSNATARRHDEAVFALRRRHDFWTAFLQLCGAQYESLVPWPKSKGVSPLVSRNSAFELPIPGAERSRQELLSKVQSRWRGLLARRRAKRLRLERLCQGLSQRQRRRFIKVQAVWRGQRSRQVLRSKGYVLPGDRRLAEYGRAATQLQAALRGSRLRQKLRWAKEVSKMTSDDMEDCPEVDLEELLNDARRVAEADPFGYLSLPQGALPPKLTPTVAVAPMAAWGTPPSTGERRDREAVGTPESPKSQPDPGAGGPLRRSRSLSSTAESATIEAEGHGVHGRGTRVEQAKEEWGFKDASTARNYLKAQKRRQAKQERPPTLPSTSSRSNLTQKSSSSRVRPGEGSCQSAQQAIEEYRRQQEAEDAQSSSGFSEFRSGSPNRKLMRSSKSLS